MEKNFEEFMNEVAAKMKDYLPDTYQEAKVHVNEVVKNNDTVYHGITLDTGAGTLSPTIYLEQFFEAYKNDCPLKVILQRIAEMYEKAVEEDAFPAEKIMELATDFEKAKEYILPKLIHQARNEKNLAGRPSTTIGEDLAVVYHLWLGELDVNFESATIAITNEMMEKYSVSVDTLHHIAVENMKKLTPATFLPISAVITGLIQTMGTKADELDDLFGEEIPGEANDFLYVLSNKQKIFGAAWILDQEELRKAKEQIGDFYILPSSIHELLLQRKAFAMDTEKPVETLNNMVCEVNATQLREEEILSDHIYQVDWETGEIIPLKSDAINISA